MDWAIGDQTGTMTANNVNYVQALRSASVLVQILGEPSYARELQDWADLVSEAINRTLYNPKTGVYDESGDHKGTFAQDTNVLAVLDGIAPAANRLGILHRTQAALSTANGTRAFSDGSGRIDIISPFMSVFEVSALFDSGETAKPRDIWGNTPATTKLFVPSANIPSANTSRRRSMACSPYVIYQLIDIA